MHTIYIICLCFCHHTYCRYCYSFTRVCGNIFFLGRFNLYARTLPSVELSKICCTYITKRSYAIFFICRLHFTLGNSAMGTQLCVCVCVCVCAFFCRFVFCCFVFFFGDLYAVFSTILTLRKYKKRILENTEYLNKTK